MGDPENALKDEVPTEKAPSLIYRPSGRSLGIIYENVTVFGAESGADGISNLPTILFKIAKWPFSKLLTRKTAASTKIKRIYQAFFSLDVRGMVSYAGIESKEMLEKFPSEVTYVSEEDIHFPTLKVKDTLGFGFRLRKPASEQRDDAAFADQMTDATLSAMGMMHTKDTIVGDAFIRRLSGGERKRITLGEGLAVNPAFGSWDNPIRGLDSSSATQFLRTLRSVSKSSRMSNAVSIYQVSEKIYEECFDRVMVLHEGQMIFYGLTSDAKQYFTDLGFECRNRQTTPDFLTSVTSPAERLIREDHRASFVPLTPVEMAHAFRNSTQYRKLLDEMERYRTTVVQDQNTITRFAQSVDELRSKWTLGKAAAPTPLFKQVWVTLRRHYQLLWGERRTFYALIAFNLANALINGSSYYMAPKDATGSYEKSCALFFSLIYFCLVGMAETTATVQSRDVLLKQSKYGFLRPAALVIAQALADIPVAFIQCLLFTCCYYFTIGLVKTASAFWIFVLIVFTYYSAIQSMFRMLGAWSPNTSIALLLAGSAVPVSLLWSGFSPTRPTQLRWGSWIRRIAPSPWVLEALIGNEFSGIDLTCPESQMVPTGSGYDDLRYQTCSIVGSEKGHRSVTGTTYMTHQFAFSRENLWRNFGILLVLWFLYTLLAGLGLTIMTRETSGSHSRVFKKSKSPSLARHATPSDDVERTSNTPSHSSCISTVQIDENEPIGQVSSKPHGSVFSFKDLSYYVNVNGEEKQLLRSISGYVKPGQLTALMGASGAGKTTLLDTLAQRNSSGRVEGQLKINGKPLGPTFPRSCGFVMQQDVHEPLATRKDGIKMAYVENVINTLDMESIADALIGTPSDGKLSVEERKRITIGVELAARPSALLFLDEPTSGLDSQAAFSLVMFLRRVAQQGIPIICTIHQPSGVLFNMFDRILLLAPGGWTVFAGETGENSANVVEYFQKNGAVIAANDNPAEFIISLVSSQGADSRPWSEVWNQSEERKTLDEVVSELQSNDSLANSYLADDVDTNQGGYALPLYAQTLEVTKRHWISVWRNGSYNFTRIWKALFIEIFIAFAFFKTKDTQQGLQNHMVAILLLAWIIPASCADLQNVWFEKWAIFTAPEKNGIYDWKALVSVCVAVELPWQIGTYTLIFVATYWTTGFPTMTTATGYFYFIWLLLAIFGTTYSQLLAALFPNATMSGHANSLIWCILLVFSGVLTPKAYMNDFYRPWLFWVDPMRYFFGGSVSSALHGLRVNCGPDEFVKFDPPPGQTCGEYAARFISQSAGYLINETSSANCQYCQYSVGDDYLETLNFHYSDKWRDWAVFLGFCVINIALLYIVMWWNKGRLQRRV
ncbi:hypothetical protein N7449_004331 [Penicillium cf. viridicatum]|uniref:ABC transporter domain-containing protein n=1 Tax=Penicillium cf. viridicatum TaxID=2972119 RepID=A0A9W9MJD0_9EURO|nr:hypothetical protein N7449_004331 [Penicillium cf. viridicatum]